MIKFTIVPGTLLLFNVLGLLFSNIMDKAFLEHVYVVLLLVHIVVAFTARGVILAEEHKWEHTLSYRYRMLPYIILPMAYSALVLRPFQKRHDNVDFEYTNMTEDWHHETVWHYFIILALFIISYMGPALVDVIRFERNRDK